MLKSEQKQLLREQAKLSEPVYVDGVVIAVPTGATEEEVEELKAYAREIMADPESDFSKRRDAAKASRISFDKRRAMAREAALAEIERANREKNGNNGPNA